MKSVKLITIVLASAFVVPVFAQNTNTPNVEKRQVVQQKRISNGTASGALTANETLNLEKREAKIEADKQAAKADGKVTRGERVRLQAEENRTSRKIYEKKHNVRTASKTK